MARLKFLSENWFTRTVVILAIGGLVMMGFYALEFTAWAEQLNQLPQVPEEGDREGGSSRPAILLLVLPFVKQAVFILAPASLTVGILAMLRRLRARMANAKS